MMRPLGGVERRLMRGLIGLLSAWQWRLYRWQDWVEQRITPVQPPGQGPGQGEVMSPPDASQDGGPPEHWAALVRHRAPWLLSRPPLRAPHPREVAPPVSPVELHREVEVRDAPLPWRPGAASRSRPEGPTPEAPVPDTRWAHRGVPLPGVGPIASGGVERKPVGMPADGTRQADERASARSRPGRVAVVRDAPARHQAQTSATTPASPLSPAVTGDDRRIPPATGGSAAPTEGTERRPAETGRHEVRPARSAVTRRGRSPGPDRGQSDSRDAPQGLAASVDPGRGQGAVANADGDPVAGPSPRRPAVRRGAPEAGPFPLPRAASPRPNRPAEAPGSTTTSWPSLPDERNESGESNRWPDLPPPVSAEARSRESALEHAARLRREQEGQGWNA
jgi:hypothetical protein